MKPHSILLLRTVPLLHDVLTNLLIQHSELNVSISDAQSIGELVCDISHTAPDVVVMVDGMPLLMMELLACQMAENANMRVIFIGRDNNMLKIFRMQEVLLVTPADLIDVINAE